MDLTRRDALAALAALGVESVAGCSSVPSLSGEVTGHEGDGPVGDHESRTLVALAEVVYPSSVDGVDSFVHTYTGGRIMGDDAYARGVADAVATFDGYTAEFYDDDYAALSADDRRAVLDYMSVDVADPDPDGTTAQRVRHYLVDELLYAFYTSPTGAGLAGLENPPGYAGGTDSYREGPSR